MNFNDDELARRRLLDALETESANTVAQVAMANVWPLYSSHLALLLSAVESLPSAVLDRYPALRIIHPLTPVLARTGLPYKPLVDPDRARTMTPDELDIVTLSQMIAFRFSGDVAGAMVYARRLQDRVLHVDSDSRGRTDGPLWFYHYEIGSTLLVAGDSSSALVEFATARQLGRLSRQADAERVVLGRIALAHAVRGSLDDAQQALADAAELPPASAPHANGTRTTERAAAALIAVEHLGEDVDCALSNLEPYDSIELSWPFDLLARARAFLAHQRHADALEAIRLATDSHSVQHGSFAIDVIRSTSIDALRGIGDTASAWRLVQSARSPGVLTDLAVVRLALHDSKFDLASSTIRQLESDVTIGPGPRAEQQLLIAWLDAAQSTALDPVTAAQVSALGGKTAFRRALTSVPRAVLTQVASGLSEDEAAVLGATSAGLTHVEVQPRPVLTDGELRVLNALPHHPTIAAIASEFHLSPNTIKSQLRAVYRKLDCSTREDAIRIALRLRLLTNTED